MIGYKNSFFIEKRVAKTKRLKYLVFLVFVLVCIVSLVIFQNIENASAGSLLEKVKQGGLDKVGSDVYGTTDPIDLRMVIVRIIQIFLSVITLLLMVYILWAGFRWMTARGDTKTVDEAKAQIKNAIIGIIIILASWGIAQFVIYQAGYITNTTISP